MIDKKCIGKDWHNRVFQISFFAWSPLRKTYFLIISKQNNNPRQMSHTQNVLLRAFILSKLLHIIILLSLHRIREVFLCFIFTVSPIHDSMAMRYGYDNVFNNTIRFIKMCKTLMMIRDNLFFSCNKIGINRVKCFMFRSEHS